MTTHPSPAALARYADPQADLDEVTMWSVETHLEDCADCRARLTAGPDLLDRVAAAVDRGIAAGPPPARRRRWSSSCATAAAWWCRWSRKAKRCWSPSTVTASA